MTKDAFYLGVPGFSDDDYPIALTAETLCRMLNLLDVGACGVNHLEPTLAGTLNNRGHDPVGADDDRGRGRHLDVVGNGDAMPLQVGDDDRVMDERTQGLDLAALLGSVLDHLEGALHAVAGACLACHLDAYHVLTYIFPGCSSRSSSRRRMTSSQAACSMATTCSLRPRPSKRSKPSGCPTLQ